MRSWSRVEWTWVDDWDGGFGWETRERIPRTAHALLVGGRVWLIDPVEVDGLDERIRALGRPGGVLQLLDRHNRDCAPIAERLRIPHLRAWERVGDAPFEAVPVRSLRVWREAALWEPASRTLVCADALGTIPPFLAPGERLGWHPLVRPFPPRSLAAFRPERVLVGHGRAVVDGAAEALQDAVALGRRRLPAAFLAALRTIGSAASR
jgi:hypothetical protein